MSQFDLRKLQNEIDDEDEYWNSFLEQPDFEVGVMYLKPGMDDTQSPHKSDEIYFIIEGDGFLNIDGEDHAVKPHTALYVPRETDHYFHSHTQPILAYYALN